VEFHQRVKKGYHQMVKMEPNRWVVVNAGQAWDSVQEELKKVVLDKLKAKSEKR
jgi:thymidylate kinase